MVFVGSKVLCEVDIKRTFPFVQAFMLSLLKNCEFELLLATRSIDLRLQPPFFGSTVHRQVVSGLVHSDGELSPGDVGLETQMQKGCIRDGFLSIDRYVARMYAINLNNP